MLDGPLASVHNGGNLAGSRDQTGNRADPPREVTRNCQNGAPGVASDNNIITSADALPQAQQWSQFRQSLENSHNSAHGYFGFSTIGDPHRSFEPDFEPALGAW